MPRIVRALLSCTSLLSLGIVSACGSQRPPSSVTAHVEQVSRDGGRFSEPDAQLQIAFHNGGRARCRVEGFALRWPLDGNARRADAFDLPAGSTLRVRTSLPGPAALGVAPDTVHVAPDVSCD
jgi:hypothetical protein